MIPNAAHLKMLRMTDELDVDDRLVANAIAANEDNDDEDDDDLILAGADA